MKRRLLLIFVILSSIVLSYYYEPDMSTFVDKTKNNNQTAETNFYLRNLETRTFNLQGLHTNTLTAMNATQLDGQKQISLDHPQMLIGLQLAPWAANAVYGVTNENLKKVTFQENVKLSRIDGVADVSTEILVFDSTDEVAYTQSPVQILARGSETTADGVHIDLKREIIQLKNNVKTYYAPQKPDHPLSHH